MAPATTRCSSISSASTTRSKNSDAPIRKKFGCSFPSCGKSFSRSEHLHRHALNHKEGNNTCQRCSAHFRRRDLLDRHMARHKEKDDEAGGEGLGILATRKRLWRDAEGNIVNARRPSYTPSQDCAKRRQLSQGSRKDCTASSASDEKCNPARPPLSTPPVPRSRTGSATSSTIDVERRTRRYPEDAEPCKSTSLPDDEDHRPAWQRPSTALASPPMSEPQSAEQSPSPELSSLDTLYEDSWPVMHQGLPEMVNSSPVMGRQSEYPASPSWGPEPFQTFMGAMTELPYDDIFKPETGLYDWQVWNSQVLSRCREEKFDPFQKREREWGSFPAEGSFRRTFGLRTC
ncbi:krueppel c2h2-type zinc finger protein [Diplocarpon rosae]|nr:krueppel c2h2-type zinc finger protein [Diplocarpon rosae]